MLAATEDSFTGHSAIEDEKVAVEKQKDANQILCRTDSTSYLESLLDWVPEEDIQRISTGADVCIEEYILGIAASAGAKLQPQSPINRPSDSKRKLSSTPKRRAAIYIIEEEDDDDLQLDEDVFDGPQPDDIKVYDIKHCERRFTRIHSLVPGLSEEVIEEVVAQHEDEPDVAADMLLDLDEVDITEQQWLPDEKAFQLDGNQRPRLSRQDPVSTPPKPARIQSQTSVENMTEKQKGTLLKMYKLLPLRALSRQFGRVAHLRLPEKLRRPVISAYIRAYKCDMDDVEEQDLTKYESLAHFFGRKLKDGSRCIDEQHCLVCPTDGKVMYYGKVKGTSMEQVKGVKYSLKEFLGPQTWRSEKEEVQNYRRSLLYHPEDNDLFHCIVYLGPGDYHAVHAPADISVTYRRHFPGQLLSVKPSVVQKVQGLFTLNERAVYISSWKHGFMAVSLVGATNVGSIKVKNDEELKTNTKSTKGGSVEYIDSQTYNEQFKKGDYFGEFSFGSTVVLVFEAPKDYEFNLQAGKTMRYGQTIGECPQKSCRS